MCHQVEVSATHWSRVQRSLADCDASLCVPFFFFFFFFFFFNWLYNPWWVLACFTILFHNPLSLHFSLQFLTFIFFKASSTCSNHLSLGLPTGLDEHGSHSVSFLTVLIVSILITCAAQRNLCDFINLTIVFCCVWSRNLRYEDTMVRVAPQRHGVGGVIVKRRGHKLVRRELYS